MKTQDNSSGASATAGAKKWLAFNKVGLTVVMIFALAIAVFGFLDPEMMAGGPESDEFVAEEVEDSAQTSGAVAGGAAASVGNSGEATGSEAPVNSAASRPRSTRAVGASAEPDLTVLYFGENDWNFLGVITLRFILNMIFAYILIVVIFTKGHRIREYSFSYFVSNILIFMVTSLLASVRVRQGFAFGLFAILSILRFRTEQLQVREMTYLFAALILGVINSLATQDLSIFAVLWANVILCMFLYICDQFFMGQTDMINLVYDNTRLLAQDKKKELYEDIKNRFGYDVVNVVVMEMNYLTDSAKIKLVYRRPSINAK